MKNLKYSPLDFQLNKNNTDFREGTGISNLDGRLWQEAGIDTARFFGDEALVRARVGIEARYLIALSNVGVVRKLTPKEKQILLALHTKIDAKVYKKLRGIESKIRHDVITMTEIMKMLMGKSRGLTDVVKYGWVHWGLSSEDVDNLAHTILIKNFIEEIYVRQLGNALKEISSLASKTKDVVIPGKTHLQTAVPTILGKEIALFGVRLLEKYAELKSFTYRGKLTGAVGNLSAQKSVYPKINWRNFSRDFVKDLGLEPNPYTTQIEPKAKLIALFQIVLNINYILIDLSQDMRMYAGFDWLAQEVKTEESGSSAMPQKVNPIDFENAHGNALFSNWILEGLIRQFPVSWLQRDLVDKTIFRNLGLPFGYSFISLISTCKGLSRVSENTNKITNDLEGDWGSLSEAWQIALRSKGMGSAYEDLKKMTRGKKLTREDIDKWIAGLKVDNKTKKTLSGISFKSYTGYARENCMEMVLKINKAVRNN